MLRKISRGVNAVVATLVLTVSLPFIAGFLHALKVTCTAIFTNK